jgi:MoaA/NifB/PqqE/SkfB family radical SAM enzyme
MINEKYCPRIFHGLTLSSTPQKSIYYSVCCWSDRPINSLSGKIDFHHPQLTELRKKNQQGELPYDHCSSCIEQEKSGKKSMRLGYLEMDGVHENYDVSLQHLDINIDMTCNLACVTCGPELSTTWRKELKIKDLSVRPKIREFLEENFSKIDLSMLKEIRIWGGEPFLTHTHKKILEFIAEKVDVSGIRLMYNTNGTCKIDQETKELIEKFKFARISFSVDGIDEKFDYLRYPAKWTEVESNLLWWKENLPHNSMLSLTVTASLLNVLYLDEVFEWHKKYFSESKFSDPIEIYVHNAFGQFGLENAPRPMIEYLQSMENYCQPWIQKLRLPPENTDIETIVRELRELDHRRKINLQTALPLTAKFLNY